MPVDTDSLVARVEEWRWWCDTVDADANPDERDVARVLSNRDCVLLGILDLQK